jgi:hypothetical protein
MMLLKKDSLRFDKLLLYGSICLMAVLTGALTVIQNSLAAWIALLIVLMIIAVRLVVLPVHAKALIFLGASALLITVYPIARVVVAGVPVYFVDIFTGITLVLAILDARRSEFNRDSRMILLFAFCVLLWVPSWIHEMLLTGLYLEPAYMFARNLLSASMFLSIILIVRDRRDFTTVALCLVGGMAATALISGLESAPVEGNPVRSLLVSLYPPLEARYASYLAKDAPVRASALLQGANVVGGVICAIVPFAYSLISWRVLPRLRAFLVVCLFLGLVGLGVTYSRSSLLSLLVILLVLTWKEKGRKRSYLIVFALICLFLIVLGETTGYYQESFVAGKIEGLLGVDPLADYNNAARVMAYTGVIPFLFQNPLWIFLGRGFAFGDLLSRDLINNQALLQIMQTQHHSIVVLNFYDQGLLPAVVGVLIFLVCLVKAISLTTKVSRGDYWIPLSLLASLFGMIPFMLTDHFYASLPYMQSLYFLVIGLTVCAPYFVRGPD